MVTPIQEKQYQFLKVLCDLFNGVDFVNEETIRAAWPDCPSHAEILNLGVGVYFDRHGDTRIHAYMPSAEGIAIVREREQARALQQLRDDFDQYRTDETAYKASQELSAKKAARKGFWLNLLSSAAAGVLSGLVVYYWPNITAAFFRMLHERDPFC